MATRAEVESHRIASRSVAVLAAAELSSYLSAESNDPGLRDRLVQFVRYLVDRYGDVSAVLAGDFYQDLREQAGIREAFTPELPEPVPAAKVENIVDRALSRVSFDDLPDDEPDSADDGGSSIEFEDDAATVSTDTFVELGTELERSVSNAVMQQGRDTVALNTSRDPKGARWARIPSGPRTCAFCLVLASRGADYRSFESAGARKLPDGSNPHAYHYDCDCVATPFWPGDEYPSGYDPDALMNMYTDARADAERGTLKRGGGGETVLTVLRRKHGLK